MLRVNVLAEFPSPHMMDFWEAFHDCEDIELRLFFEKPTVSTKSWGRVAEALNTETTDWSKLSIADKVRWVKRVGGTTADAWILDDNYLFWEHHLLASWMRRKSIPTVFLAERTYWERRQSTGVRDWRNVVYQALKKAIIPFLIRDFDALACHGVWAVEQYRDIAPDRYIFPTEYYVDLDDLRQIERPKKRPNDHVNLGFCGGLIPRKGLRYILHNLGVISQFHNWQLKVAGDGPLRGELEAAIPSKLRHRVEFLGNVSSHEMKDFWRDIDALLFPSLFDGWGMVVVEALAAGAPVISGPNVGAARQYIKNEYNGEIRDVNGSFLQAIVPLLEAPEKLNELSANARASVKNYRPEIGAKNFVRHLKTLAKQG
ncbi:glycosyltransferase family 4 protein [Candidatus Poribacteria bacterium]